MVFNPRPLLWCADNKEMTLLWYFCLGGITRQVLAVSLAAALVVQDNVLAEMLKLANWGGINSGFPNDNPESNTTSI